MKKVKLIMAIVTVLFFSALAYTNWKERSKTDHKYTESMEEIKDGSTEDTFKKKAREAQ